jgi:hypothetical protein
MKENRGGRECWGAANETTIMSRSLVITALAGLLTAVLTAHFLNPAVRHAPQAAVTAETWPICSSMGLVTESVDWAALDLDFAAGKRAMAAGDWPCCHQGAHPGRTARRP